MTFYNVYVSSTSGNVEFSLTSFTIGGSLSINSNVSTNTVGSALTVTGATTISSSGNFTVSGGNNTFNSTTTNAGTIYFGPTLSTQTFNSGFVNTGTFTSGSSTVVFGGSLDQTIPSVTYYNMTVNKSSGTATLAGHATTTGAFTATLGDFNYGGFFLEAMGDVTRVCTGSGGFMLGTGTLHATGGNNQAFSEVVATNIIINKTGGTVTSVGSGCTGTAITTGTLSLLGGTLNGGTSALIKTGTFTISGGTFTPGTGTFQYTASTTAAATVYNNLTIDSVGGQTVSLGASTTAVGALSVNPGDTLAVGTNVLTVVGTISNTGLITVNTAGGGKIVHTAESVKITNSSGTEVSSISTGGVLYVTVQDSNRNLNGTTVETMTIPVSFNAAAGSDSETMTLTETSVSSGIFRNTSAINVVNSTVASPGNSQFELAGSGVGTGNYVDNQDAADTGSDTVTLTYVAASASGGSGGGGLGSSGSPALPPLVTQFQSNLQNLQDQGIAVHSLVKLPDDSNPSTQHDTAVYYIGSDGKRHAFPHEKVYFTWYMDFSGVQIVNDTQLASIPLGANVTYKPGKKMVKFTTDNKVYVVAKGGVLRWVTTEAAATELYGTDWNTKIDDISDAFYSNYTFGANVTGLADFNPTLVEASVTFPSDSLQM
jgi:hypothetical protein